jgi:hypothetical protein
MGGGQTGSTLNIDGAPNSITNWARAGDYFNVAGRLHRLTANANSNGSGQVTLNFEPPIYVAPADNAPITCNPASIQMRLLGDNDGEWSSGVGAIYESKSFSAVEAL